MLQQIAPCLFGESARIIDGEQESIFADLPPEIVDHIFAFDYDVEELGNLRNTCRRWREIADQGQMFQRFTDSMPPPDFEGSFRDWMIGERKIINGLMNNWLEKWPSVIPSKSQRSQYIRTYATKLADDAELNERKRWSIIGSQKGALVGGLAIGLPIALAASLMAPAVVAGGVVLSVAGGGVIGSSHYGDQMWAEELHTFSPRFQTWERGLCSDVLSNKAMEKLRYDPIGKAHKSVYYRADGVTGEYESYLNICVCEDRLGNVYNCGSFLAWSPQCRFGIYAINPRRSTDKCMANYRLDKWYAPSAPSSWIVIDMAHAHLGREGDLMDGLPSTGLTALPSFRTEMALYARALYLLHKGANSAEIPETHREALQGALTKLEGLREEKWERACQQIDQARVLYRDIVPTQWRTISQRLVAEMQQARQGNKFVKFTPLLHRQKLLQLASG